MVHSNCEDLKYRAEAVDLAILNKVQLKSQPDRLPQNIYGTEGEWEEFSTPSRDARLKTSFKELRDQVQRFVEWQEVASMPCEFPRHYVDHFAALTGFAAGLSSARKTILFAAPSMRSASGPGRASFLVKPYRFVIFGTSADFV